jgi:hypothetical protein
MLCMPVGKSDLIANTIILHAYAAHVLNFLVAAAED